MVPSWKTDWSKTPESWVDYPDSVPMVMKTFDSIIAKVKESMFWFAYEQQRYNFIMTVVTMAAAEGSRCVRP